MQVLECPSIQTLDIQSNKIEDPDVVDVVAAMPNLRVLYLQVGILLLYPFLIVMLLGS